jgi:hypothetical protein
MARPKDAVPVEKAEGKKVRGIAEAADAFVETAEYTQIKKNYDYFSGGSKIEKSLRGGYDRFSLGSLANDKAANRSPKADNTLWRAPAQKDDETWVEFTTRRVVYVNYTKLIVQERGSILYKTPPVREFTGALKSELEAVYSDPENGSKGKFVSFHRNAILGGTVAVIPYPDPESDRIFLRGYPRKSFHALFDPYTGDMTGFCIFGTRYNSKTRQTEDFYQVWTPDGVYDLDKHKRIQSITKHHCGTIPVTLFRENNDDLSEIHFGNVTATDLVINNEDINVKLSDLSYVSEAQAFSLLFTKNVADDIRVGARGRINARNITADQEVGAEYLNPGAQLAELQTILTSSIETLFMTGRIPKAVIMPDDQATSGIHLKIQWFPVQKLFEEAKVSYGDNERRLAQNIALVKTRWKAAAPSASVPTVEMEVDFNEKNVMPSDDETKIQADEWDLSQGLKSPVDILMERNPDLDEEEAVAEYERVKEINKRIGYTPNGGNTGTFEQKKTKSDALQAIEDEDEEL